MTMDRPDGQDSMSSLGRALALLDTFTPDHPEMTVRELSRRSGVTRSTTHRLVKELVAWGALERGSRGVRLGVKLFELGTLAPSQTTLREAASPFLHTLNEVTRLTANLAIREGSEIVYLEKISTRSLRVPHSRLGGRGVLHATALGKALAAFAGVSVPGELVATPLVAVTEKTITDPAALVAELARVRRDRAAFDLEESRSGLFCVAAPVLDSRQVAIAAISVTGATAYSEVERFAPTVIATANAIARRLSQTGG